MIGFKTNTKNGISYYVSKLTDDDMEFMSELVGNYKLASKTHDKVEQAKLKRTFKNKYEIDILNVLAYGTTDNIKASILHKIIEQRPITVKGKDRSDTTNAYRCFSINYKDDRCNHYSRNSVQGFTLLNTIMHESYIDSWKCLLEVLHEPEYVLIYKEIDDE